MKDLPDISGFILFVILIFPGFISYRTYRLIFGGVPIDPKALLIEVSFYSALNLCLSIPILIVFYEPEMIKISPFRFISLMYLVLVFIPIALPMAWAKFSKTKVFASTYQLPFTTSWDYFFSKRDVVWVKLTLNDGGSIGGIYGFDSYATSAPNDGEIYMEKVYDIDDDGHWKERTNTKGAILRKGDYKLIEFFATESEPQPENKGEQNASRTQTNS